MYLVLQILRNRNFGRLPVLSTMRHIRCHSRSCGQNWTDTCSEPSPLRQENRRRMLGNCSVFGDGRHARSSVDAGFRRLAARSGTDRVSRLLDRYPKGSPSVAACARELTEPKRQRGAVNAACPPRGRYPPGLSHRPSRSTREQFGTEAI